MRFVIQRVKEASVTVYEEDAAGKILPDGKVTGSIGKGFMVLVGACQSKVLGLRLFEDENGKTNLSLDSVKGSLLLVSQFTLYADCRKGNRPSFLDAGDPAHAKELYEYIVEQCRTAGYEVGTGVFGAQMDVALINDGPFTIILDSDTL